MWIVKNTLRATLTFRGLDLSIGDGEEFDLDSLGRDAAEESNQVRVAFEEGYLENVHKDYVDDAPTLPALAPAPGQSGHISVEQLNTFKNEFLQELRTELPRLADREQFEGLRTAIGEDVKELVVELKELRTRFASVKGRVEDDASLSDAEIRARLAFLDEQERELLKNFETVGRQVEQDDGDVMDMANLLADL